MKVLISLIIVLITAISVSGQEKKLFLFNEFNASVNKTSSTDDNTEGRIGFGVGLYRVMIDTKKLNIVTGLEYNLTNHYKEKFYEGIYANASDITYSLNDISIPLSVRYHVGNTLKIFIELGGFADINIGARRRGTYTVYYSDQFGNVTKVDTPFNESVSLTGINYGPTAGLGLKIPVQNKAIILRVDYKYGLAQVYSPTNLYNRYFRLGVAYKI